MKKIKSIYFLSLLIISLTACGQTKNERTILGKAHAQEELNAALSDKLQHNLIDNKTKIIKDSVTAINVAESILFSIYGKDKIVLQRPYEIYYIDNYWVISGTFLTIIDSRDSKVLRIIHGK